MQESTRYRVLSGEIVEGLIGGWVMLRLVVSTEDQVATGAQTIELVLSPLLTERLAEVLSYLAGLTSEPPSFEIEGLDEF